MHETAKTAENGADRQHSDSEYVFPQFRHEAFDFLNWIDEFGSSHLRRCLGEARLIHHQFTNQVYEPIEPPRGHTHRGFFSQRFPDNFLAGGLSIRLWLSALETAFARRWGDPHIRVRRVCQQPDFEVAPIFDE